MKLDRLFLTVLAMCASLLILGGGTAGAVTGQLDPSFGNDGVASPVLGSGDRQVPVDAVVQTDGRILVVGYSEPGPRGLIARLMPDGTPDPSFGDGGTVETGDIEGWDAVTLQTDGKIVATGHTGTKLTIARFNEDGTPDPGFGIAGRFAFDVTSLLSPYEAGAKEPRGLAAKILSDGDIRIAARFKACSSPSYCPPELLLAGTDPYGSADPQLGPSGARRVRSHGNSLLLLSENGAATRFSGDSPYGDPPDYSSYTVTQIGPDGTADTASAKRSHLASTVKLDATAARAVRDAQGRILLATDSTVLRFLEDGTLDHSFGDKGAQYVEPDIALFARKGDPYPPVSLFGIAINPDGRILLSGTVGKTMDQLDPPSGMAIRLLSNGKPDPTFGAGGMTIAWRGTKTKSSIPGRTRLVTTGPDSSMIVGLGAHGDDLGVNLASLSNGEAPWLTCNGKKADYIGTDRDDEIFAASGKTIVLGDGNDRVKGGHLTVCAGPGDDLIDVGRIGPNLVFAGPGADTVTGSRFRDEFHGGPGPDRILGMAAADTLYGDAGNDLLSGGSGDDHIYGLAGNDRIYGGDRDDRLHGGSGPDSLFGGNGFDRLIGGPGRDELRPGPASGSRFTDFFYRSEGLFLRINRSGRKLKVNGVVRPRCDNDQRPISAFHYTVRLRSNGRFRLAHRRADEIVSVTSIEGRLSGRSIRGRLRFIDSYGGVICSTGKRPVIFPLSQAWVPFHARVHPRQKQMVRQ